MPHPMEFCLLFRGRGHCSMQPAQGRQSSLVMATGSRKHRGTNSATTPTLTTPTLGLHRLHSASSVPAVGVGCRLSYRIPIRHFSSSSVDPSNSNQKGWWRMVEVLLRCSQVRIRNSSSRLLIQQCRRIPLLHWTLRPLLRHRRALSLPLLRSN